MQNYILVFVFVINFSNDFVLEIKNKRYVTEMCLLQDSSFGVILGEFEWYSVAFFLVRWTALNL